MTSIAIVGSGALGSYYGARLALAGNEVRFLMRGDLAHVRAHGVKLVEKNGTHVLSPAAVFGTAVEIGPVDLVFVALKTTGNHELSRLLPPLVHDRTLVITLQNGLGNEEEIAAVVGPGRAAGGLCFIAATRTGPGEVTCYEPGTMAVGEVAGPATERMRAVAALFVAAGIRCAAEDSLMQARWRKLVWNIPFNGLAVAAGGITIDRILASPALKSRVRQLMDETARAARALGHEVAESFIQYQIDRTLDLGAYQPSTLIDYLAGREMEIEAIWGEPLRRGVAAGVAMPELARLYEELKGAGRKSAV
ncbi:MAG: 2-dehydropantoate 2-reductase [Verrucomicrobia bacterium]|jgi:2-dehydropantoate 2-reductase|nr:MAG: 2-dehydropantoate 2-reductase [Verrucomicrobiota bacterium]